MLNVKRVYEKPSREDGIRVLVDRLWPRGLTKADAKIDIWLKEISPSDALRKWFNHDPAKWVEFKRRYSAELKGKKNLLDTLREEARRGTVTLVFGAKDEKHNNAVALAALIEHAKWQT